MHNDEGCKMTPQELYAIGGEEIGGHEAADMIWGDFCDWENERTMFYWITVSQWHREIQRTWHNQTKSLLNQLFGGTRVLFE